MDDRDFVQIILRIHFKWFYLHSTLFRIGSVIKSESETKTIERFHHANYITENENDGKMRTFPGPCHLKLGVQPVGMFGNMHTRKLPGFCGNVNWMTVGWEDCGSLAADGTWDVAPVASAEFCFCGAGAAATGAATQPQQTASVHLPRVLGRGWGQEPTANTAVCFRV